MRIYSYIDTIKTTCQHLVQLLIVLLVFQADLSWSFDDVVSGRWGADDIAVLADNGITRGCDSENYCPDRELQRAEMAIFLLRGVHGADFTPSAATGALFDDVSTDHWAGHFIEELAGLGIANGCDVDQFCPSREVTRGEMAIFLLRSLHGGSYTPPSPTGQVFGDINADYWAAAFIEQLAADGLSESTLDNVRSCESNYFCPSLPINRAEMAVWLVRAFELTGSTDDEPVGNPTNGEALYTSQGCALSNCHTADPGTNQFNIQNGSTISAIENAMASVPLMVAMGFDLTEQELADIAAYLATFGNIDNGEGNSSDGEVLFNDSGCSQGSCHGTDLTENLNNIQAGSDPGVIANAINSVTQMVAMAFDFSEEELENLAAWITIASQKTQFSENTQLAGHPTYRSYSAQAVDYDGDDDLDLYVVNYLRGNYLYRNNGDETFTEVAEAAGVNDSGKGGNGSWADYDLDGDMDLYLINVIGDTNTLYRNEGDGTFTDVTLNAGLRIWGYRDDMDAAWLDYDLDGDPDLYLLQNGHLLHAEGMGNLLYRNNGDGTFSDVTAMAGVGDIGAAVKVGVADYNQDGYPDLYVANFTNLNLPDQYDSLPNVLYRNNGDGTFSNITATATIFDNLGGYDVDWGDFNNDGLPDLYVSNLLDVLPDSTNSLFINLGNDRFDSIGPTAGVDHSASTVGATWADFNQDGFEDLLISNIETTDYLVLYQNNGDNTFSDITQSAGLDLTAPGNQPLAADFNNDGYPDLFIPRIGYPNALFINQGGNGFKKSPFPSSQSPQKPSSPTLDKNTPTPRAVVGTLNMDLTVEPMDAQTIRVTWDLEDGGDVTAETHIHLSSQSGSFDINQPTATADPGRDSWLIDGLTPETAYFVRIFQSFGSDLKANTIEGFVRTYPFNYEADARPALINNCTHRGCHFDRNPIMLEDTPVSELVNVLSVQVPTMNYITPFDMDQSYLWHKINGTQNAAGGYGVTMPKDWADPLRDWELEVIESWIEDGAPAVGLTILTDGTDFETGDAIVGSAYAYGGEGEHFDLYLTLRFPDGEIHYLTLVDEAYLLEESAAPLIPGQMIASGERIDLFVLNDEVLGLTGSYEIIGWLVASGEIGGDESSLMSNRSTFEFEITP
ncbi:MAG: VCBS repeat-containing protein [Magnetococcales bacterium]|nr:VCBS repeat-containing protein [Magnetococcales bacterium]